MAADLSRSGACSLTWCSTCSRRRGTPDPAYSLTREGTPELNGDPPLIQKAIYQLMVNAIKYTPDGGKIHITAPERDGRWLSQRRDRRPGQGIGLDAEHHDLVFEKFYQVGTVALHSPGKTTFKGGGPGLGLALVRGVARAHGGKVWVESAGHDEVNFTGSTFI